MQKRFCNVCGEEIDPDSGFYSLIARIKGSMQLLDEESDICSVRCLVDYATKLDRRVVKQTISHKGEIESIKFMWGSQEVSSDDIEEIEGRFYLTSEAYIRHRD